VSEMPPVGSILTRLKQAASLAELLAASFDAFEAIRIVARDHQEQVLAMFAAFMTTADTTVNGREDLTIAPSLPQPTPARRAATWHPAPKPAKPPTPWPLADPRGRRGGVLAGGTIAWRGGQGGRMGQAVAEHGRDRAVGVPCNHDLRQDFG
jgi:hypothetical protein